MPDNNERKALAKRMSFKKDEMFINAVCLIDISDIVCQDGVFLMAEDHQSVNNAAQKLAMLIDPGKKTLDEWLKETLGICYDKMEGCDDPEWSLYSTIADAIVEYRKGRGGFSICHPYDHDGCPLWSSQDGEEVHDGKQRPSDS